MAYALPIAAVVTAAASTYQAVNANQQAQHAKGAAEALAQQQKTELENEANAAQQLAATQAITGQTFGGQRVTDAVSSGLGFGTAKPGGARASLTGLD